MIDLSEQLQDLSQTGELAMDPVCALDAMLTTEFTVTIWPKMITDVSLESIPKQQIRINL